MADKITTTPNRLAADVRGVQDLRSKFRDDPKGGLKAAAQQFEAMFLQMVMKSMRDATPQDGMLNSDSTRFYTSMLDQQLAQNMATSGKGLGFAKIIEQQLGRYMPDATTPATSGTSTGVSEPTTGNSLPLSASSARHLAAAKLASYGRTLAASGEKVAAEPTSAPASGKEFVERVWPHAVEASRATGIPPQFLVAHAALESGWGKSEPRTSSGAPSYNLFGIKAGKSWSGESVEVMTTEYIDGQPQKMKDKFRAYASYGEAFTDYARLLRNNPRYGNVVGSQDGTEFARRLQQAGYATDPDYANKLANIIHGPTLRQALTG